MTTPDLTIIVATYDRADWLAVSLQSILTSAAFARLRGIETGILVVDDGSPTEATRRVAEQLGVEYARNPVNDGRKTPSVARVLGLGRVESLYVAFFDDDDVMLPRWIPLHVAALEAGHDVCSTAYWWTDEELAIQREVVPIPATMGDLLVGRIPINDQSLMRMEHARGIAWDPDLDNVMEYAAWLELMYRGRSFHRISEPTFLYRRHQANISSQLDERDAALRRQLQERYRALVLARDGVLPEPTPKPAPSPRPRPAARPLWRRAASRVRRAISR